MKKLFTSIFLLLILISQAQSPVEVRDEENSMALVSNNQVFTGSVAAMGTASHHFDIKNISANTITVTVRKYEDLINTVTISDKAAAYYCFDGVCWSPSIITATYQLTAGSSFSFIPKLDEASVMGESNIRYRVSSSGYDLYLTLKYNIPAGIKDLLTEFSSLSLYPNPSSGEIFAKIKSESDLNTANLIIYNSLGSIVKAKEIEINKGYNLLSLGTEQLSAGIYFVQFNQGKSRITKKITITN
jgi:hypothetical protein